MGLFNKITSALSGKSEETRVLEKEIATLKRDGRLHARHVLHEPNIVTITMPSGATASVRDISYSGFGVVFPQGAKDQVPTAMTAIITRLKIVDQDIEMKAAPVHWIERPGIGTFVGMRIQHEAADTLAAIRELIEPLSWGGSLHAIDQSVRNERYKGDEWSCFRGEGPTDLVLRAAPNRKDLQEALLTFRLQGDYHDLSLRDGRLSSSRSDKAAAYGGHQMVGSGDFDPLVLRKALCILAGAPTAARHTAAPLFNLTLEALQRKSPKGSGAA